MKTSWSDTFYIENYLQGKLSPGNRLMFEARLLMSRKLRTDLYFQKKVHTMVNLYHRKKLKEELDALHQALFNDPNKVVFQERIHQLFKTKNS
jgi:hypothetical protein